MTEFEKDIKEPFKILGSSHVLWVELDREEWEGFMDDALVRFIIFIGEKCHPALRKIFNVNSKTMVLRRHVAVSAAVKTCWLVVSSISVSRKYF